MAVTKTLRELAAFLGGTVAGDGTVEITGVRGIEEAGTGDITFIANPKYRRFLETTAASAVIVPPDIGKSSKNLLIIEKPYVALARLLPLFYREEPDHTGVSAKAHVDPGARIAADVTIYPGAFVGRGAVIARGAVIHPGVSIGNHVHIGEDSVLYPNVTVYRRCTIGRRVILHAGVVVGSDGFGFASPGTDNIKVSQVGTVQIDDDCEIGANCTIDRGALGRTWIQRGVKMDNLVQIGHNVVVGENAIIVAQVGISGSSKLGKGVLVGGQAGVAGHITIGDHAMVAAKTGIHRDVAAHQIVSGFVQMPHEEFLRVNSTMPKLPEMRKTILTLRKRVEELEHELKKLKEELSRDTR